MNHALCCCNELGPITGGVLLCVRCGHPWHPCRYCPSIYISSSKLDVHSLICDSKTVLDDIVEAIEESSGLPTASNVAAGSINNKVDELHIPSVTNGGMST